MKQLLKTIILAGLVLVAADRVFAMEFTVDNFPQSEDKYITAQGAIEEGDYAKFIAFVKDNPFLGKGTMVNLHSGGGDVDAAQGIAYQINLSGFNTAVIKGNLCASACTDMMLGGVERFGQVGAKIGYHSASISNYDDFTGAELLMLGQEFAIGDIYFALLYTPDDISGWKVAQFYNEVFSRPDNSIMMYPSMDRLLEAGMITKII